MSKFIGKGIYSSGSLTECAINFTNSINTGIYESSTGVINFVAAGTSFIQLDTAVQIQSVANMNSNKIINVATPTAGTDGANKSYVDSAITSVEYVAGNGLNLTTLTFSVVGSATILSVSGGVSVNSSATANQVLLSAGTVGTSATYGAVPLGNTNSVTGTLVVANGGTGVATFTSNGVLIGNGTGAVQVSSTTLNSAGTMVMTGALFINVRSVSTATTVAVSATDYMLIINNSATVTATLPAASSNIGRQLIIVKTGATSTNQLTITPNGSDTINGTLLTVALSSQYSRISLTCDGVSTWYC
jgi:hypothetical protein